MEAKEKAKELFNKYKPICAGYNGGQSNKYFSKQAAFIAVDEMITEMSDYFDKYDCTDTLSKIEYWQQVKTEINNL